MRVESLLLNYVGGSNSDGLEIRNNSRIDLDGASSASQVVAFGQNRLIGHDAANITLVMRGNNTDQHSYLTVVGSMVSTGTIVLGSNSTNGYGALFTIDAGTFTNAGTMRSEPDPNNANPIRIIELSPSGTGTFINTGTLEARANASLTVRGSTGNIDTFTQQAGLMTAASGAAIEVDSMAFNYAGGTNTGEIRLRGGTINLAGASASSTVVAIGTNTLVGFAATNLTLINRATNAAQTANLFVDATASSAGTILLDSDSTAGYPSFLSIRAGTFTNTGTIRATYTPTATGPRLIDMSDTAFAPATFVNAGTIQVDPQGALTLRGSSNIAPTADTFIQQAGTLSVGTDAGLSVESLVFRYTGGSNTSGVSARSTAIDLDAASAASTVNAVGTNLLLGHDAANITLLVLGQNVTQTGLLSVTGNVTTSGLIVLDSNSTSGYGAFLSIENGAAYTNTGTLRVMQGLGVRVFNVDANATATNAGKLRLVGDADLAGSGLLTNGNGGTIQKPDAGESTFGLSLRNTGSGLVDVDAGTLRFLGSDNNIGDPAGAFLSGGYYTVADGATLGFASTAQPFLRPAINTADVEVHGTGVVEFNRLAINRGRIALLDGADTTFDPDGATRFVNEGILDLSPTSVLTIVGGMDFAGASQPVIRSEIASLTDFGRINVTGSVNLNSPLSTSRFDPDLVGAYDPPVGTLFNVIAATAGVSSGFDSFQGGLTPGGNILTISKTANAVGVLIQPGPLPPAPQILSQSYEYLTRQAVTFQFDQDVSAFLSRKDYQVVNLTTGQTLTQSAGTLTFNTTSNQATLDLTNQLPDGNYRLTVNASDIANSAGVPASGSPIVLDFFVLAGDANHDRSVNFQDLVVLAQNYNLAGKTSAQGNVNYSAGGEVDFQDLVILAQQYNKSLGLAPPPLLAPPTRGASGLPGKGGRVAGDVLT